MIPLAAMVPTTWAIGSPWATSKTAGDPEPPIGNALATNQTTTRQHEQADRTERRRQCVVVGDVRATALRVAARPRV